MAPTQIRNGRFATIAAAARRFFAAAPCSLKNHLNIQELSRITVTAMTAGGGAFAVIQAFVANAQTIFPAAPDAALAVAVMTSILEIHRRLGQGTEAPSCHSRPEPLAGSTERRGRPKREAR